jgi:hypothetical protein
LTSQLAPPILSFQADPQAGVGMSSVGWGRPPRRRISLCPRGTNRRRPERDHAPNRDPGTQPGPVWLANGSKLHPGDP